MIQKKSHLNVKNKTTVIKLVMGQPTVRTGEGIIGKDIKSGG